MAVIKYTSYGQMQLAKDEALKRMQDGYPDCPRLRASMRSDEQPRGELLPPINKRGTIQ